MKESMSTEDDDDTAAVYLQKSRSRRKFVASYPLKFIMFFFMIAYLIEYSRALCKFFTIVTNFL
jgi:hypothetical protein